MKGYGIGIFELLFFFLISGFIRAYTNKLRTINKITYYWMMLTILTGVWEIAYLTNYNYVLDMAESLVEQGKHVWTNNYDFSYVLPWKLSWIFYAEYGAWADREYMSDSDNWSHVIEGTHCSQCALFCLFAILSKLFKNHSNYCLTLGVAMGTQFMNSVLYMSCYFIQETEESNVNFNNASFPSDKWLTKRPFMWVNIFWLIMPFYIINYYLIDNFRGQAMKIVKDKLEEKVDSDVESEFEV